MFERVDNVVRMQVVTPKVEETRGEPQSEAETAQAESPVSFGGEAHGSVSPGNQDIRDRIDTVCSLFDHVWRNLTRVDSELQAIGSAAEALAVGRREHDRALADLAEARQERDRLESQLEAASEDRNHTAAELEEARQERARTAINMQSVRRELDRVSAELSEVRRERDRVAIDLEASRHEYERVSATSKTCGSSATASMGSWIWCGAS